MNFLALDQLEKTYADGTPAVRGIDLGIEEGELIVLLGPSGCGKTTTLRMIAGLELPTGGSIRLDGREVTTLRPSQRDVGMVFQFYALYPHLSVGENIGFPLRAAGLRSGEIDARVSTVAERMNLGRMLDHLPRALSGGDQQKVALARAMVRRPAVYLMDEPLGTLDSDQRLAMRELIRAEQLESRVTTVYVTHDQEEAMSLADRIVVMQGGLIRQVGTPAEVYDQPADLFVATFVGSPGMNLIAGGLSSPAGGDALFISERGRVRVEIPRAFPHLSRWGGAVAGRALLGIRCEHVHEDPLGPIAGQVVAEEYLGHARQVHVDTEAGRLILRGGPERAHPPGAELRLRLDPAEISVFDAATEERL